MNKKNIIIYLICLTFTLIIFMPFLHGHYVIDTYNIEAMGYKDYSIKYNLKDGRPIMALTNYIMYLLNMPIKEYVVITLVGAICVSNIIVIKLKMIIEKYRKAENLQQEIITTIISYITIFNFMYLDCLDFTECFVISISLLLFIKAAEILVCREKKSFIKSMIIALIGILSYQSTITIFIVFVVAFSIIEDKNNIKTVIKSIVLCGVISVIALLVNYGLIRIVCSVFSLSTSRVNINLNIIIRNVILSIKYGKNVLIYSCDLWPSGFFIICVVTIFLLTTIYLIKNKYGYRIILALLFITLVAIYSCFILNIISTSSFFGGRTRLSIGMTVGIMFIYVFIKTNIFQNENLYYYLFGGILIIYLYTTILNYEYLMIGQKKVNKIDTEKILELENYIENYEFSTGNKINKIVKVLYRNQKDKSYYKGVPHYSFFVSVLRYAEFADRVLIYKLKWENVESRNIGRNE